jgi:hypothetical protein
MGQLTIPGTTIQYSNPAQTNQATNVFPAGMVTAEYPANVNGSLAGVTWVQNGATAYPQPYSTDPSPATANPVQFNASPVLLSAGGVKIPNSSVVLKNPS